MKLINLIIIILLTSCAIEREDLGFQIDPSLASDIEEKISESNGIMIGAMELRITEDDF